MRVIAGLYRSRLLASPPGTSTRPTSDRLRETLFNILAPRLEGCRFVDLYAGTGAVGIEAISRGAVFCWFAEKAEPALKSLRGNLAALKIVHGFSVEDRGTGALLQKVAKLKGQIDIVFLDPPYEAEVEYEGTLKFLGSAAGRAMLSESAVVLAEHASKGKFKLEERYGGLVRTREYKQGEASVSFDSVEAVLPDARPAQAAVTS
jgi:16S rRNA (guanine(966)-N(2))-methyltransferase RsmD